MNPSPPETGEVWFADLEPVRGSEQGRRRPVVIIQNPALAKFTSTLLAVPLTTMDGPKGGGRSPRSGRRVGAQEPAFERSPCEIRQSLTADS